MMRSIKVSKVASFIVLKKYHFKILVFTHVFNTRGKIGADMGKQAWVLDKNEFQKHFPHLADYLLYKKLFKNNGKLEGSDWRDILPPRVYYKTTMTAIELQGQWLIFLHQTSGRFMTTKKDLAERMQCLEKLEKYLKRSKMTMKFVKVEDLNG